MHKEYATEWTVLELPESGMEIVSDEEDLLDTEGFTSYAATVVIPVAKDVHVFWETARTPEGPWAVMEEQEDFPVAADGYAQHWIAGTGADVSAAYRMDRYVRLRFVAVAANARICYRMTGLLKA